MSLNATPAAERVHIAFFGQRNTGKSSLVNAVTGQNLAIVSDIKGTTTDPVYKAMELLPVGPVMIIDTPGFDDEGELGRLRVKKTRQVLNKTDVAVLVIDAAVGRSPADQELIKDFERRNINYVVVVNKADLAVPPPAASADEIWVSARTGFNVHELKEHIARLSMSGEPSRHIVADLLAPGDLVLLVVPLDSAAPKGRLILPQQQTIRDILEADAAAVVVKETGLRQTLAGLGRKPSLVITDSQAFAQVARDTPRDIPLTSFSILFARYKGSLEITAQGAAAVDWLQDGDRVLISEGCTHHRQCDDIGTVKLPRWIGQHTGKQLGFEFTSATGFPDDLTPYDLIVHCGGCMLNEREVRYRLQCAREQGVAITNYGILIAYMNGILPRTLEPFPDIARVLTE
ncbi:MAG: [FeFe] hydrogenase H-cluster maturation GTPase HydF [Syntrophomonadaceae bacterium]